MSNTPSALPSFPPPLQSLIPAFQPITSRSLFVGHKNCLTTAIVSQPKLNGFH